MVFNYFLILVLPLDLSWSNRMRRQWWWIRPKYDNPLLIFLILHWLTWFQLGYFGYIPSNLSSEGLYLQGPANFTLLHFPRILFFWIHFSIDFCSTVALRWLSLARNGVVIVSNCVNYVEKSMLFVQRKIHITPTTPLSFFPESVTTVVDVVQIRIKLIFVQISKFN